MYLQRNNICSFQVIGGSTVCGIDKASCVLLCSFMKHSNKMSVNIFVVGCRLHTMEGFVCPFERSKILSLHGAQLLRASWGVSRLLPRKWKLIRVSDSWQPHGLDSPGQNTGVGSISVLQWIFPTQELNQGLLHCRQILFLIYLFKLEANYFTIWWWVLSYFDSNQTQGYK